MQFSTKKWSGYLRRPKAEGRIPKAWPGPAGGAGARRPKTENRFCHFPTKKWSGYLRRPKAEGRIPKAWPGPAGGVGARRPKTACHFPQKMVRVPPKTESRRPNPESLARPSGRGRGLKTENRKPFLSFSPKNGPGTSEDRKPKAESRKLGPAQREGQGPEDRKPKTENRFCHFPTKNGPGTSEDRKPKAESRKLGPAQLEGQGPEEGPKTENRFCRFPPKNGPGTSEDRKPKAESRKLGPAQREGQEPEDRKPKTVFDIFTQKMVRVPPKTESRRPNPESLARPSGRGRGPKTENRFHRIQVGWLRSHRYAATLSPKPGTFFRNLYTLHHAYPLVNHLSYVPARFASLRSAARAATRSQNGLTKGQPKSERSAVQQKDGSRGDQRGAKCIGFGRKHPVWGRAPLPRLAPTVYYNLIVLNFTMHRSKV